MVGVDQFNLIGDQRLVDKQVIQLGALENETRGGIARIKIGAVGRPGRRPGSRCSATQILDSTFLTFGIGSALDATDTASATAGFAKEDVDDPQKDDDGGFAWGNSALRQHLQRRLPTSTRANAERRRRDGKAAIQVAGAFAFSFTDHDVKTLITSTADLNSNDDMELTSRRSPRSSRSRAESTARSSRARRTHAERRPRDASNTSADNSISAAIVVGIENNASHAIVEGGADSTRCARCACSRA